MTFELLDLEADLDARQHAALGWTIAVGGAAAEPDFLVFRRQLDPAIQIPVHAGVPRPGPLDAVGGGGPTRRGSPRRARGCDSASSPQRRPSRRFSDPARVCGTMRWEAGSPVRTYNVESCHARFCTVSLRDALPHVL